MFLNTIALLLLIAGAFLILNLTPAKIAEDMMDMLRPKDGLRSKVDNVREHKKRGGLYGILSTLKESLEATGKGKFFPLSFGAAVVMAILGGAFALLLGNPFLVPAFALAAGMLPFGYIYGIVNAYRKHTEQELETTLSVISNSYLRSNNLVQAVSENLNYIKPPLQHIFKTFVGDATYISSNVKQALFNLREKLDDEIFYEWCTTLIQCQDDRTMRDNLLPIVGKLTDVRLVNNQLETMMSAVRMEYYVMVGLVLFNIPLLYMLNIDWFKTLMFTTPGMITQGICALAIVITYLFLIKFTQPIRYKG